MRPWTNKTVALGVIGLICLIVGSLLSCTWRVIFDGILKKELPLTPNSRSYELWKDTSKLPMNIDFYFFNWTNPEELRVPGKKPNFVQMGPYSFVERRVKVNIVFHPKNNTVSYDQMKYWYFDAKRSNGTLQDKVVNLNTVAVSAAHTIRYWLPVMQSTLSFILASSKIYVEKTVSELLFEGYKDEIISMSSMVASDEFEVPPFDRFGWFYMRNGSTFFDGHYNVATGQEDLSELGIVKYWNYKDTTKYYRSPCNVVEGSAGEFWPPNPPKDDVISIWTADLCRPLVYEYSEEVMHQGMKGYKYQLGRISLGNNTKRRYPHEQAKYFEKTTTTEDFFSAELTTPSNINNNKSKNSINKEDDPDVVNIGQCFCNGECTPMGLINITACRYGAPGFVSLPHFHKADPIIRDQVVGMNPKDEEHNFYVTLEPNTGIPLDVAARLQINILLQPSLTVDFFRNVPRVYFPMFWFNFRGGTPDNLAWGLKQLLTLPSTGLYTSLAMAILGVVLIVIVIIIQFIRTSSPMTGKSRKIREANGTKTELVYMDTTTSLDDHERSDRPLRPKD
ncbi:protein croquemort-like [Microplitis mediator]|uniref:protein croquemort-like n=1 Tax=Microplitis mediator TaxID=375433 RepID=UPI002555EAB7|nr:protein croquemort-like [Microplitis mediator]XP_057336646.1 protein croquemort-like [Microplitis mediator]